MKWSAQVAHVALKDVRWSRWLILAYAAVVASATAFALEWPTQRPPDFPWQLLLLLLGMIVVASIVQADSPTRTDAFWATRPLHPSAVFSAKLVVAAVVVVGVGILGELLALLAHDVAATHLPAMLGASAFAYASVLGIAGVVAALTRDLRTFMLALILILVVENFVIAAIIDLVRGSPDTAGPDSYLVSAAMVGGMVLLVAHQYRTRNVRRGIWLALLLMVLGGAVGLLPAPIRPDEFARRATVPASLQTGQLRIEQLRIEDKADGGSRVHFVVGLQGGSPLHRHMMVASVVHLYGADGRRHNVVRGEDALLDQPAVRPQAQLRWLGSPEPSGSHGTGISVDLSASQTQVLVEPGGRLTLQGRIEVQEPRMPEAVPLAPGARTASDGVRFRFIAARITPNGPLLEVRRSSITVPGSGGSRRDLHVRTRRAFSYALVNPRRSEAIHLVEGSAAGSGLGLVLPGSGASTMSVQLRTVPYSPYPRSSAKAVSVGWLQDARLQLVHWVPVGSYSAESESAAATAPALRSPDVLRGARNAVR